MPEIGLQLITVEAVPPRILHDLLLEYRVGGIVLPACLAVSSRVLAEEGEGEPEAD